MIRIAIQAKGRLNEESIALLKEAGISIEDSKRKLLARSDGFPLQAAGQKRGLPDRGALPARR